MNINWSSKFRDIYDLLARIASHTLELIGPLKSLTDSSNSAYVRFASTPAVTVSSGTVTASVQNSSGTVLATSVDPLQAFPRPGIDLDFRRFCSLI